MIQSVIQAILQALFGALTTYLQARQADANLQALGYSNAQRDLAVSQIKAVTAVVAAQQRMATVPVGTVAATADSLRSGQF